jgi:hypothetical protein
VRDLVAGSELVFEEAGEHELNGVPDRWRLYRVAISADVLSVVGTSGSVVGVEIA